jgi:putative Ca2+/H+ antiporter (TMEM165/GDT1 family)
VTLQQQTTKKYSLATVGDKRRIFVVAVAVEYTDRLVVVVGTLFVAAAEVVDVVVGKVDEGKQKKRTSSIQSTDLQLCWSNLTGNHVCDGAERTEVQKH